MTIEKGKEWGEPIQIESVPLVVDSDATLARQSHDSVLSLSKGNVFDALGQPRAVKAGETRQNISIDALICTITFANSTVSTMLASSDVVIGSFLTISHRQTEFLVITNTGLVHGKNFAPRAHPNDGKFDVAVFASAMSVRQRLQARSRLKTGTHVPHPHISVTQHVQFQYDRVSKEQSLRIDGHKIPTWVSISIAIKPDYWSVIV